MVVGEASILCIKERKRERTERDCDVIKIIPEMAVWAMWKGLEVPANIL